MDQAMHDIGMDPAVEETVRKIPVEEQLRDTPGRQSHEAEPWQPVASAEQEAGHQHPARPSDVHCQPMSAQVSGDYPLNTICNVQAAPGTDNRAVSIAIGSSVA